MASLTENGTTWTYTYDASGMRTSRTGDGKTYTYTYNGSRLVQMTVGSDTLRFTYDAAGTPLTVTYNGTTYYYVTNIQGDVIGIVTTDGTTVVTYSYNSWGKLLEVDGALKLTLGELNPIRYRGYVYDTETALYYLQSRYYDPVVGRLINVDALISTGQGFIGNNMFPYCLNNPVNGADNNGKTSDSYAGLIGELIGAFIYELITGDDHPQQQVQALENQVIQEQNKMIADAVGAVWDACMHEYNLREESIRFQAAANIDMFDSPKDIERSLDIIEATVSFSAASYEVATILITPTPLSVKAVAIIGVGFIWSIRGLIRALQ